VSEWAEEEEEEEFPEFSAEQEKMIDNAFAASGDGSFEFIEGRRTGN